MLVPSSEPEIGLPACSHDREKVSMIGHVHADISPLVPYLNAILPDAIFYTGAGTLRFQFEGHPVALQSHEMMIGGLVDTDEGVELMTRLQQFLNDTWARRAEIVPSTWARSLPSTSTQRVSPEAWAMVPRTSTNGVSPR